MQDMTHAQLCTMRSVRFYLIKTAIGIMVFSCLLIGNAPSFAQTNCGDPGFTSHCATFHPLDYWGWGSACFDAPLSEDYPLNLALWYGFGPPDLPPRSTDPIECSLPFVAADARQPRGPNPYAVRPTHAGLIDLITGVPLYQEIDFELPFGSALFRHVRTHADNVTGRFAGGYWAAIQDIGFPQAPAWDWNGQYWMMSENPILLIDAHFDQLNPNETMSYLILDMHHTIPFRKVGDAYVSPPWFDAALWHNEETPPTEYYVKLDRGAITYTFSPHYEDTGVMLADCSNSNCLPGTCSGNYCEVDAHLPPSEGGYGVPYYAFLTKINDRNDNRAVINYVDFVEYDCGRSVGCCQNCNEKGQIRSIRLYPGGSEIAEWTLVYLHRPFRAAYSGDLVWDVWNEPFGTWDLWQQHQLHSIHVYHRDVPDSEITGAATLPASAFYGDGYCGNGLASFDDYDAIDEVSLGGLPSDWKLRCEYLYEEPDSWWYQCALDTVGSSCQYARAYECMTNVVNYSIFGSANLLKSTVTRQSDSSSDESSSSTFYRYPEGYCDDCNWLEGCYYGPIAKDEGSSKYADVGNTLRMVISDHSAQTIKKALGLPSANEILTLPAYLAITTNNPVSGEPIVKELREFADIMMRDTISSDPYFFDGNPNGFSSDDPDPNALFTELGYDWEQARLDYRWRRIFVDRRNGEQYYRITRLQLYPEQYQQQCGPRDHIYDDMVDPATFHYPYRSTPFGPCPITASCIEPQLESPPWDFPTHVAIIDEFEPLSNCDAFAYTYDTTRTKRRRVVEMNIAGFILSERIIEYDTDGQGSIVSQTGFRTQRFYDEMGRIFAVGTEGWGSEENFENQTTASLGLVRRFLYEEDPENPDGPGELAAIGIQEGFDPEDPDANEVYWTQRFTRHPERFDLIIEEARFNTPQTNINATPDESTQYYYELNSNNAVSDKLIMRGATQRTEGGSSFYSVDRTQYSEDGKEIFHGVGGATDETMANVSEFFATYREYNNDQAPAAERGQLKLIEEDSDRGAGDYARVATDSLLSAPLLLQTNIDYDPVFGPRKITYPNGRETHILFVPDAVHGSVYHQWTYSDVIPPPSGTGTCQVLSPVQYARYQGMTKTKERKLAITSTTYPPDGSDDPNDPGYLITESVPTYDSTGRVVSTTQTGADGNAITAAILYHATGQIERQQQPDGSIERYVYDQYGRLSKVFRGTSDTHAHWGLAPPCELNDPNNPNDDPNCPDVCPGFDDNLALVEKRAYGVGITNANRLTEVRSYREGVTNRYFDACLNGDPYPAPNDEDAIGWVTTHEYDWRMREVWMTRKDAAGNPLSHSVTWLDHQDRPRIMAEYGPTAATAGSALDPRAAGPSAVPPTAEAFLNGGAPLPLSLTEKVYNARGLVEESRHYFVESLGVNDTARYTSTITYYDYADRPVEVHMPGSPIQQYVYDAKGRQVASRSIADDLIIAETVTTYDLNDRAIISTRWERNHDETDPDVDDSTGVTSYTYTWYDQAGRVLASANFGTADDDDHFVSGSAPPAYASTDAADARAAGALVTEYTYDDAGRQTSVRHPDGTLTTNEYDDLGRTILMIENAESTDSDLIRRTAYKYDATTGQLTHMAAVLPSHGAVTSFSQINWGATDGSLQVTEFFYNAEVVARDGGGDALTSAYSSNKSWISEVRYPSPADGQPDTDRALKFKYYSDGLLAYREDANGNIFTHYYDELGRRILTLVDDDNVYGSSSYCYAPEKRVNRLTYSYRGDGLLETATAEWYEEAGTCGATGGAGYRYISDHEFAYDGVGNLLYERQEHGNAITTNTPTIDYSWEDTDDFNRLTSVTYPARGGGQLGRRLLTYEYDSRGNIHAIHDDDGYSAYYEYAGVSRRVALDYGPTSGAPIVSQSYVGGAGYSGLDRFGRIADLHYFLGDNPPVLGPSLHRYQYQYDAGGNRLSARVAQAPNGSTSHDNDRSYLYGYDTLNRLIESGQGKLNSTNDALLNGSSDPIPRVTQWSLDNLGNWDGSPNGYVETGDLNHDGDDTDPEDTLEINHNVDAANQIASATEDAGGGAATTTFKYDLNGNLIFDGVYWYQYDAWNRLCQIHPAGSLSASSFDDYGRLTNPGSAPDWTVRYIYDAFGRLMRKRMPHPDNATKKITENYYYDGVRRIFTELNRPVVSGSSLANGLFFQQYVYGPGYVDELVAICDGSGPPRYVLQDANYNVMAVVNGASGVSTGDRVIEQWQYSPYGVPRVAERLVSSPTGGGSFGFSHFVNSAGHQGLFFDRLDDDASNPGLAADADGVYVNRARTLIPRLGRFAQKDVGGTSLLPRQLQDNEKPNTQEHFSAYIHFIDGVNLYVYAKCNPIVYTDPVGTDVSLYGIAGGPVWFLPASIGYLAGQIYAGSVGFGTESNSGIAAMWLNKFGPGYLEGTPEGVAKWAIQDVLPEIAEDLLNLVPPGAQIGYGRIAQHLARQFRYGGGFSALSIAAPVTLFMGFYSGVLDSVIASVEYDMSGDTPDAWRFPWE